MNFQMRTNNNTISWSGNRTSRIPSTSTVERMCIDLVKTATSSHSRKYTPLEQGCIAAWFCDAIWTRQRALDAGYIIDPTCELCGAAPDTVWHRIWLCKAPQCLAARAEAAPWWIVTKAKRAGPSSTVFSKGIFPHPEALVPRPYQESDSVDRRAHEGGHGIVAFTAAGTQVSLGSLQPRGNIFVDGSCTRHPVRDLNRASFSVVMVNSLAQAVLRIQSPIWAHLPQSPQAAEYCALAAACELIGGEATIFGDCANVIRDAQLPSGLAVAPRKLYAGIIRSARGAQGFGLSSVVKVPAHVTETDDMPPDELFRVRGNTAADTEAKAAYHCHAHAPPEVRKGIGRTVSEALHVIAVAAALLPLWSGLPKGLQKAPKAEPSARSPPHQTLYIQDTAPAATLRSPYMELTCSDIPYVDPSS